MPQPIFSLKKLDIKKGKQKILNINKFDIHRGTAYMIHGRMGSGKTTLIDLLSRRKKIKKGELLYEMKNIYSYSKKEYNDQIAFVDQESKTPWGTVDKYLYKTISKYSFNDKNSVERKIGSIVQKMEIGDLQNQKLSTLSPGQFRWVKLAACIAADTKVLFIDEIEMHLGKYEINKLAKILYRKCNYDGVTLIATTQNKELLNQRLSSIIISLDSGKITSVKSSNKKNKKPDKRK